MERKKEKKFKLKKEELPKIEETKQLWEELYN